MPVNIDEEKKHKGVRYSISIFIPSGLTLLVSKIPFNDDWKSFVLMVIAATPLGIDKIVRLCFISYYKKRRDKELSQYKDDIEKMLTDDNLTEEMRINCVNKLSEIQKKKMETHETELSRFDNTLANLDI